MSDLRVDKSPLTGMINAAKEELRVKHALAREAATYQNTTGAGRSGLLAMPEA